MMKLNILLSLSLLFCCGCLDNTFPTLEEQGDNIFAPDGPALFTITSVVQQRIDFSTRRLEIDFTNVLDQVPSLQRENINGILYTSPGRSTDLELDRTRIVDGPYEVGTTPCFSLVFTAVDGGSSRETAFCITIE
ncbi:hypothetical protein SAMN05444359_104172 [Neolewinella agarilytica]|uniref:Uncharacterized protein n=1 Tax=Neolewinella agarilytica TaxID=478744 RepID=A0A1H9CEZ4_9BACT|nr:hypothetical protein SAMN05444359_104172 [Neolewinella agarilytica]